MVLRSCIQGIHRSKKNIKRIKKWINLENLIFLNYGVFLVILQRKVILNFITLWGRWIHRICLTLPCPSHDFRHVTLELRQFCSQHSFEMVFGMFSCSLDVICMNFNIFTSFLIDVRLFESELVYYSEMLKSKNVEGAVCVSTFTIDGAAWGTESLIMGSTL